MSRGWWVLAVVTACTASDPAMPTTPGPLPLACPEPVCPGSPMAAAPQPACPACPAPVVEPPPEPEVHDWHCMPYRPRGEKVAWTFCWVSRAICESKRVKVRKKRMGTTGPCEAFPIAYCLDVLEGAAISKETTCTSNVKDCESARKEMLEKKTPFDHVSTCEPTRNSDRFKTFRNIGVEARDPAVQR